MFGAFTKVRWAVFDCLTGEWTSVEHLPFEIGSDEGVDLRLNGGELYAKHCALTAVKGRRCVSLVKRDERAQVLLNGAASEAMAALEPDCDYSLQVGSHFLLLRGGTDLERWRKELDHTSWSVFFPETQDYAGPWTMPELRRTAARQHWNPLAVALPTGASMGFYLRQIFGVFPLETRPPPLPVTADGSDNSMENPSALSGDIGELTCPIDYLKFDLGDLMHVAVHDSLRGDPILGQDAPLRFHATQFNDRGQALDAFGLPCTDVACPHCRRILPPGFVDVQHHIISIVGDQSAGKSYYLSVLAKLLPLALYRQFAVTFYDADPAGNAMLNDMKKTLFSAQTPEQAHLVKTQLEGAMYERVPRYGRVVAMPKPFIFYMHSAREPHRRCSAIFYDNAGEHFQPGRDSADSPGAQHVASASGIVFLFDPFNHPEFRKRMRGQADPQLEQPVQDQQDTILSELNVRVKKLLNLEMSDRIPQPLALVVGKCDAWAHLLGEKPLADPVQPGRLDLERVNENSDRVRKLLLEIAPIIVANTEVISGNVRYFPVSSFGHPPVKIGAGQYVPDPRQLRPILAETPVLWILAQAQLNLVPTA
ncbi:MAG: hypothetical protein L0Z50_32925 [Verrucomicrobiales bacterium]|nr:hypothetical protein [Verrucomicrobiales bacterium]